MLDEEIMDDFDGDKYIKHYCNKMNCTLCEVKNESGELEGYGCHGLDSRIKNMYISILRRRRRRKKLKIIN